MLFDRAFHVIPTIFYAKLASIILNVDFCIIEPRVETQEKACNGAGRVDVALGLPDPALHIAKV